MENEVIKPEPLCKEKKQNLEQYSGLTVYDISKCFEEFFSPDDIKSAVLYAVGLANELQDLESRGNTLEVLRKSFPVIFQELKETT